MAVLNTYQVGQVRRPVVLEVNTLLLSVELILHLQMLIMHAISSLVNVLQHQIQEVVSEEIVGNVISLLSCTPSNSNTGFTNIL